MKEYFAPELKVLPAQQSAVMLSSTEIEIKDANDLFKEDF